MRRNVKLDFESSLESRRMLTEFVVNSFEDFADDGDASTMSLREAVTLANEMPGPDSILFDPSIFNQERTIQLSLGEIGITDELSIDASDVEQRVTVDAQLQSRIFNVQGPVAGSYSFSNLSLVRGSFSNSTSIAFMEDGGGAIRLSVPRGEVALVDVDVTRSRAVDAHGGGIYGEDLARLSITDSWIANNRVEGSLTSGGGIYSQSTLPSRANELVLVDSVVRRNTVAGNDSFGGGVVGDDVQLLRSTVASNRVVGDWAIAGGILGRMVRLDESVVAGNSAGGGSHTQSGGGIRAVDVTVVDSTVSGNTVGNNEGGSGGGISANTVSVVGSTFTSNVARQGRGGAINADSVTISDSSVSSNRAGQGGAISARQIRIEGSMLSSNSAVWSGGAVAQSRNPGERSIEILNSTFNRNRASADASSQFRPTGGGIIASRGTITIRHSTFAFNESALLLGGEINLVIDSSVFSGNGTLSLDEPFGDLDLQSEDISVEISNSIIGDNVGSSLEESQTRDEFGNLIGSSSGDGIIDPMLGPLADNGGPTPTRALLPGSPAIDAGSVESDDATDQRGGPYHRIVGAASDIGAFEVQTSRCVEPSSVSDIDVCAANVEERDMVLAEIGSPLGDLDDDGAVTVADFLVLSRNFGKDEDAFFSEGDLSLDGVIDVRDFLVLSSKFATNT